MCRNIKTLFNFDPPATEDEIRAASVQFVRKLSGFNKPSQANQEAFDRAVAEVTSRRAFVVEFTAHECLTAISRGGGSEGERAVDATVRPVALSYI